MHKERAKSAKPTGEIVSNFLSQDFHRSSGSQECLSPVSDFTSIADGTIDGLLQLSILSGGAFEFDPTAPLGRGPIRILEGVGGPNTIGAQAADGVVSELTLNGDPLPNTGHVSEPTTLSLLAAGLIAGAAFRKRFK